MIETKEIIIKGKTMKAYTIRDAEGNIIGQNNGNPPANWDVFMYALKQLIDQGIIK